MNPTDLIRAYLAGSGLPATAEGVLMRSGVHREAARRWAVNLSLTPRGQEEEEEMAEGEPDVGMGQGNEVLINGPILADGFERFIYELLGWAYCSADKVRERMSAIEGEVVLRINSPGGHTTEMAAIAVQIAERRKMGDQVNAVVDGMAASAAGVLFLLCDERRMSEFGQLMLHRAWIAIIVVGNQNDVRNAIDGPLSGLEAFDSQQLSLIQRVSGQSAAWARNTLDKELWYGRDQAVDSRLATGGYPDEQGAGEDEGEGAGEARLDAAPPAAPDASVDPVPTAAAALQRALTILEL